MEDDRLSLMTGINFRHRIHYGLYGNNNHFLKLYHWRFYSNNQLFKKYDAFNHQVELMPRQDPLY